MRRWLGLAIIWAGVLAASVPLVQRIPNGADHYFMIDVGETQIVLNNWGTLHMTGYPHYVMLGNLFTDALTALGMRPLMAAAVFSLVCGLAALGVLYALAVRLSGRVWLSAAVVLLYGLTRTVWIHHVIAEIYTFGLLILAGLLWLALAWRPSEDMPRSARIYALALLGGVGVAHHRAIAMAAPALLYAAWDDFPRQLRQLPRVLLAALGLGLLGFVPYAYLVIRARAGADWVYGDPSDWAGLWEQFTGAEAARFIGLPDTWAGLLNNLKIVNTVLLTDVTLPGLVVGLAGLTWALTRPRHRRAAVTLWLSGGVAYAFHVALYTDVLSALILPVTLSVAFGWLYTGDAVLTLAERRAGRVRWATVGGCVAVAGLLAGVLIARNAGFIRELVTDTRGLETIETVQQAPDGSTLMLPWGPRYFAAGYARDIEGGLQHVQLVDHTADYTDAFQAGALVVPEYVQFRYPLDWWREQLNADITPQTAAPGIVALLPDAETAPPPDALTVEHDLTCTDDALHLHLTWTAPEETLRPLTAFAHLLDADGALVAQDDHPPVYGWRPTQTWQPGAVVRDIHMLPRHPDGERVRYGLYYQADDGTFVNEVERELEVDCDA